ncbi:MAG: hypothetical protein IT222_01425 [Crocinitomix sp.]|nr:hypothetical protein [Crocinitomix sp.]
MGTLNEVYQLKPITLAASAILKVKKNCENSFLHSFNLENIETKTKPIFSDTFVSIKNNGNVERMAIYSPTRTINFKEPGIYLSIQSDGKWGFNDAFIEGIKSSAPFLADSLFFVIYDTQISRFEILDGQLNIQVTTDFDKWDHQFDKYIITHFQDSPQLIADYYIDHVFEMKLFLEDLVANNDDPGAYYELEEYEDLLTKILQYGEYSSPKELKTIKDWLQERIAFQKNWEDQHYQ